MKLANKWTTELIGKDKSKSQSAAKHIVNTPDSEAWKCLVDNSEYLFAYIKDKAVNTLIKEFDINNIDNIFELIKYHSAEYDDYFAEKASQFRTDELDNKFINILQYGSDEEKAYSAKYFCYTGDNKVAKLLLENFKSEYSPLKVNTATALGVLKDKDSYNFYLEQLQSNDDWEKLEAAQFLSAYGKKEAVSAILNAMSKSSIPEHIAGEAVNLVEFSELFQSNEPDLFLSSIDAFDKILSSIPEVWQLSAIIDFNFYEALQKLVDLPTELDKRLKYKVSCLLLRVRHKLNLFFQDQQFTFDEDKLVINELKEICTSLSTMNKEFWDIHEENVINIILSENESEKLYAVVLIKEIKLNKALPFLIKELNNTDNSQQILAELIFALKELDKVRDISNIEDVINRILDDNLRFIVLNSLDSAK